MMDKTSKKTTKYCLICKHAIQDSDDPDWGFSCDMLDITIDDLDMLCLEPSYFELVDKEDFLGGYYDEC